MVTVVLIVAFAAGAIFLASKDKKLLAVMLSCAASAMFFVAVPQVLSQQTFYIVWYITLILGLVGVIIALVALLQENVPTAIVLLGVVVALWAAFRLIPTFPITFAHLGPNLQKVGSDLAVTAKDFWNDVTGKK